MIKEGEWWLSSETDPRWNCSGRDYVGGFEMPAKASEALEEKKKEFGVEPPEDLEFGYMKD